MCECVCVGVGCEMCHTGTVLLHPDPLFGTLVPVPQVLERVAIDGYQPHTQWELPSAIENCRPPGSAPS